MKIRLTEQDLYYLVENCVKHTINEMARHYGKDEFIAAARKKHGNRYDYSQVNYVDYKTPVRIICPKEGHGSFDQTPKNHIRGHGCPKCRISRLERIVNLVLTELNVAFIQHHNPKWLQGQHIDFYIEELNHGIECQGIQHFKVVKCFGGEAEFFLQKKRDMLKRIKCIGNQVNVTYIDYMDSDSVIKRKVEMLVNNLKNQTNDMVN